MRGAHAQTNGVPSFYEKDDIMTKNSFFPLPKNDPGDKDWKVPFSEALKPNTRFQQLIHLLFSLMNGGHYAMNNSSQDDLLHVVWQDFKNAFHYTPNMRGGLLT